MFIFNLILGAASRRDQLHPCSGNYFKEILISQTFQNQIIIRRSNSQSFQKETEKLKFNSDRLVVSRRVSLILILPKLNLKTFVSREYGESKKCETTISFWENIELIIIIIFQRLQEDFVVHYSRFKLFGIVFQFSFLIDLQVSDAESISNSRTSPKSTKIWKTKMLFHI